jgi:hypothetical protein
MKDKPKFTLRRVEQIDAESARYEVTCADSISAYARETLSERLAAFIESELADELIELGFDPETIVFEVQAMVKP